MKTRFSTHWVSSTQPRKQRKYRANAPLHIRGAFLSAGLSKEMRTKYGRRSIRIRTGDDVLVMRGQYAGRTGKVERVDLIRTRIFITGVDQSKRDGSRRLYPIQPSNVQITKVADDKRRFADANAKVATPKAPKAASKPASAPAAKAKVKA